MSIVKMKRLRLIALARDRDELLSSLLHAGCVEVSEPPGGPGGPPAPARQGPGGGGQKRVGGAEAGL